MTDQDEAKGCFYTVLSIIGLLLLIWLVTRIDQIFVKLDTFIK